MLTSYIKEHVHDNLSIRLSKLNSEVYDDLACTLERIKPCLDALDMGISIGDPRCDGVLAIKGHIFDCSANVDLHVQNLSVEMLLKVIHRATEYNTQVSSHIYGPIKVDEFCNISAKNLYVTEKSLFNADKEPQCIADVFRWDLVLRIFMSCMTHIKEGLIAEGSGTDAIPSIMQLYQGICDEVCPSKKYYTRHLAVTGCSRIIMGEWEKWDIYSPNSLDIYKHLMSHSISFMTSYIPNGEQEDFRLNILKCIKDKLKNIAKSNKQNKIIDFSHILAELQVQYTSKDIYVEEDYNGFKIKFIRDTHPLYFLKIADSPHVLSISREHKMAQRFTLVDKLQSDTI